jgi:hypothetical protein
VSLKIRVVSTLSNGQKIGLIILEWDEGMTPVDFNIMKSEQTGAIG